MRTRSKKAGGPGACAAWERAKRVWILAGFCALVCGSVTGAVLPEPLGDELFETPRVVALSISLSPNAVAALQAEPKKPVPATVSCNGRAFTNVVLHLKGLGSFQPISEKPSFSIKFTGKKATERLFGQARILLENSSQDETFLCRRLCSEIFLKERIPAARVCWATVRLNGRELGLYTLSEAMTRHFLKRHFRSGSGNLYEGSDVDVGEELEQDSGSPSIGRPEIRALIAACQEPDLTKRWRLIQARLDVDRFISYAALEILITHHDGYCLDLNNYRLYWDPSTERITFIPHGMDLVFDRPELPLDPEWKGLVARGVMGTTEGARQYRQRVRELARAIYFNGTLARRIDSWAAFLRPIVSQQSGDASAKFNEAVDSLKARVKLRARLLSSHGG